MITVCLTLALLIEFMTLSIEVNRAREPSNLPVISSRAILPLDKIFLTSFPCLRDVIIIIHKENKFQHTLVIYLQIYLSDVGILYLPTKYSY